MAPTKNLKIYIRHCDERTVPVLWHYFKEFDIQLINGVNRPFKEVLYENFSLITNQKQEYALVADGDLLPLVKIKHLLKIMLTPLQSNSSLITTNGTRIDKFLKSKGPLDGGFKAYKREGVKKYLDAFEYDSKISDYRPESHLYRKVGGVCNIRLKYPLCGHEYGQFLWHIYEKGFQRGVKSLVHRVELRECNHCNDIDFEVYGESLNKGLKFGVGTDHFVELDSYKATNLPTKYHNLEKNPISDVTTEYSKLLSEVREHSVTDKMRYGFSYLNKLRNL